MLPYVTLYTHTISTVVCPTNHSVIQIVFQLCAVKGTRSLAFSHRMAPHWLLMLQMGEGFACVCVDTDVHHLQTADLGVGSRRTRNGEN